MSEWLKKFFGDELVQQLLRTIVVAVLVCLLGLLGYDVVLDPRGTWGEVPEIPQPPRGGEPVPRADVGGTSHFSNLETTGDLTVGDYGIFVEQSVVVCTEGAPITATGTYQPITSTAAITTSTTCAVYSGTVTGQLVYLVNENASDSIIVDDGAITDLGGNVTLGAGDILKLLWDGVNWLGLGTANN